MQEKRADRQQHRHPVQVLVRVLVGLEADWLVPVFADIRAKLRSKLGKGLQRSQGFEGGDAHQLPGLSRGRHPAPPPPHLQPPPPYLNIF